jgi:lanosterol synthase
VFMFFSQYTLLKSWPAYSSTSIKRAIQYLHNSQYPEGGWIGSWGICFTYGTWFALLGLTTFGEDYANSARVRRACHYLLEYQKEDGGWGESFRSCFTGKYVQAEKTSMAQTSWAAMALMLAQYPDVNPVERAVKKVMDSQLPVCTYFLLSRWT